MSEPLDLEPIKAREKAATPGPWRVVRTHDAWAQVDRGHGLNRGMVADCLLAGDPDFVAHARQDVPALVKEVERLRAALNRIQIHARALTFEHGSDPRAVEEDVIAIAVAALGQKATDVNGERT